MNLNEMEKLCEIATPGPWDIRAIHRALDWMSNNADDLNDQGLNAKFIAASRDFVPWACKRIRELEEIESKYEGLCK